MLNLILPQTSNHIWVQSAIVGIFAFWLLFLNGRHHNKSFKILFTISLLLAVVIILRPFPTSQMGLFFLIGFLKTTKKNANRKERGASPKNEAISKIMELQKEKEALRKRILETPNTFYSQAHFFQSLLTLNEVHFVQSLVEATAHFLSCNKVSFFQFIPSENHFQKKASFRPTTGLDLSQNVVYKDRVLHLVKESRSVISVKEIVNNTSLHNLWRDSLTRALIYCPIFNGKYFYGILTIDEMKFHHLNRETIKNLVALTKIAGQSFRNIYYHQKLITEKKEVQAQVLPEYQQLLKALNFEFKRAKRNELPLSLIYLAIEASEGAHLPGKDEQRLFNKIKSACIKNLREVDLVFDDEKPGHFWILLPLTDFKGMAYVLERLSLVMNMELASQHNYLCYFGFSSLEEDHKLPRMMIDTCKESYRLHQMVRKLIATKEETL